MINQLQSIGLCSDETHRAGTCRDVRLLRRTTSSSFVAVDADREVDRGDEYDRPAHRRVDVRVVDVELAVQDVQLDFAAEPILMLKPGEMMNIEHEKEDRHDDADDQRDTRAKANAAGDAQHAIETQQREHDGDEIVGEVVRVGEQFTGEHVAMDDIDVEREREDDGHGDEQVDRIEHGLEGEIPFGGRVSVERARLEQLDELVVGPRGEKDDEDAHETQEPFE